MHIADGIVSGEVSLAAGIGTAIATAYILKKIKSSDIPKISVMTAAFFSASLIHVKIGVTSSHLMLSGLMGAVLGPASFPAIVVALVLQAVMFQHGGITAIGVNSISMGAPAILGYLFYLFSKVDKGSRKIVKNILLFCGGFIPIIVSGILMFLFLYFSATEYLESAKIAAFIQLPLGVVEGIITIFAINFIEKVKPELLK